MTASLAVISELGKCRRSRVATYRNCMRLYAAISSVAGQLCMLSCAQGDRSVCATDLHSGLFLQRNTEEIKLLLQARSYSDCHAAALCFFCIVSALYHHQFLSVRKSPNRALLIQLHKELVLDQVTFNYVVKEKPMEFGAQISDSMFHSSYFCPFKERNVIKGSTARLRWLCRRQNQSD